MIMIFYVYEDDYYCGLAEPEPPRASDSVTGGVLSGTGIPLFGQRLQEAFKI